MPKLDPKQVQKDLEKGLLWPMYWVYGQERMKSRELLKRIRRTVLGSEEQGGAGLFGIAGFAEETLDAGETTVDRVVEAAQSLSLGGGLRFIVVRDAHLLKEPERLSALFGPAGKKEDLTSVCVLLSKDLDGRKKFSKQLVEKAAVVSCEEVPEEDREAWIGYLSKKKGVSLPPALILQMRGLDPWSLDIVDGELEKYVMSQENPEVLLGSLGQQQGADSFLDAFLGRDLKNSLSMIESFADSPEESLPLLGLLAWNVRHLALLIGDRAHGTHDAKLGSFLMDRMRRWVDRWGLREILELQESLAEVDFCMKQTPRLPLGLWTTLALRYCRDTSYSKARG